MATLPLFEEPTLFGWTTSYGNVIPNASSQGFSWNANLWGEKV
jgi:hypothetical protein